MNYPQKWLCSYETVLFDTVDGDIDIGQYALDENGTGYYIRTKPKTEAQFDHVDLTYKVAGLKKVNIVPGHAYYDEFLTAIGATNLWTLLSIHAGKDPSQLPSGSVLRVQSTGKKYWDTARIKDYPQPTRSEVVDVLPPVEPLPKKSDHHSIALDVASNSGAKSSISSYSWNHTCTGDNRLLVVGDSNNSDLYGTDITVTGITYNTVAMTYIRSDRGGSAATGYYRSTLYYKVAPDSGGAKTIAVTLSGTQYGAVGGAISYTGAAQSGQPEKHNGAAGTTGATATVDVTTLVDNCWVASVFLNSGASPTSGNTQRWKVSTFTHSYNGGSDTNGPKTPAGSQTMSWTWTGNYIWAISAASFAPAAPPPAAPAFKLKMIPVLPWIKSRLYKSLSLKGG